MSHRDTDSFLDKAVFAAIVGAVAVIAVGFSMVIAMACIAIPTDRPMEPPAVFACQDGSQSSCVPIRRDGGAWAMTSVSSDGTLGDGMARGDRLVILNPGITSEEPNWVRHGKITKAEFNLHDGETLPVLLPDGTLAVARGNGDRLFLSQAHRIAKAGNPAQPHSMADAALAAR